MYTLVPCTCRSWANLFTFFDACFFFVDFSCFLSAGFNLSLGFGPILYFSARARSEVFDLSDKTDPRWPKLNNPKTMECAKKCNNIQI